MEKRTLLAVVLSLLVLYIYSAMTPSPSAPVKESQLIGNEEFVEKRSVSQKAERAMVRELGPEAASGDAAEKLSTLETSQLFLKFSNLGGDLVSATIKKHDYTLPVARVFSVVGYENAGFQLTKIDNEEIIYSLVTPELHIQKVYRVARDSNFIQARVKIENTTNMSKQNAVLLNALVVDTSSLDNSADRDKSLFEYSIALEGSIFRKGSAFKFSSKDEKEGAGPVRWVGFRDRYFCVVVAPEFVPTGYNIETLDQSRLAINLDTDQTLLNPNASIDFQSNIYIGPQSPALLDEEMRGIISFSGFGLFDWTAKLLYRFLLVLNKVIPNLGLCILVMSVVVYLAMYPLTAKGMSSMRKMQELQPRIAQIREQHKSNPQRMNKEIMEIYKGNRINPFGGCFPFLLQMPVFIGLYQVLWRSAELKGASFLWIKDLAEPDRLFLLPFQIPFLGNEVNILPLIMMVVMFFQQKFSSRNITTLDPAQATQQKLMGTIFPVFLGVIFYKFASGLCLYFTVFYVLSTLTQWKMSKATKVIK
jgi:YidC/Oxa1 family membrane protein insertase